MIRVLTVGEYEPKHLEKFCNGLFAAFGVGCEFSKTVALPKGMVSSIDAEKFMLEVEGTACFADDKLLYLLPLPFKDRTLRSGKVPTQGHALHQKGRAAISTAPWADLEKDLKVVSRHALHQVGHLWKLFHCLDPRCAMYPPWSMEFNQGSASFCDFCQEKSEQQIRLAKS